MKINSYETSDVATPVFDETEAFILEQGAIYADERENGKVFLADDQGSCITLATGEVFDPHDTWESDQQVSMVKNLVMSL